MPRKPDNLAERLRRLRDAAGLSPAQVADAAGIARAVYSRLESGLREPSWRTLRKVAKALKISLGEFDDCE